MVTDHAGHTSPQKEQLFTLLMNTPLPRLWCSLSSSPSEELCTSCFVSCQAGQLRRQSGLGPRLPSEWTEMATWFASRCLSWQRLLLPCSLTASLYTIVAITSLLLNRHLLQQLEQTDAARCLSSQQWRMRGSQVQCLLLAYFCIDSWFKNPEDQCFVHFQPQRHFYYRDSIAKWFSVLQWGDRHLFTWCKTNISGKSGFF